MAWQQTNCPSCSGAIQVFEAMYGTDVSCPHCGAKVTIQPPAPPPAPQANPVDPYDQIQETATPIYWIVVAILVVVGVVGFLVLFLGIRLTVR